jgi:hypothetical protein
MKKEKKKPAADTTKDQLPNPGKDRKKMPSLPITDKLKEKLKKARKQDPNIYPLW